MVVNELGVILPDWVTKCQEKSLPVAVFFGGNRQRICREVCNPSENGRPFNRSHLELRRFRRWLGAFVWTEHTFDEAKDLSWDLTGCRH